MQQQHECLIYSNAHNTSYQSPKRFRCVRCELHCTAIHEPNGGINCSDFSTIKLMLWAKFKVHCGVIVNFLSIPEQLPFLAATSQFVVVIQGISRDKTNKNTC